jgi:YidC/Oxa1 family membrane protein insertase
MVLTANIFQPLITVFEAVLKFFHNSLGVPWGWAIVLLTVAIRLLLVPLAVKQFHSMQKLQRIAPELKKVQGRYKDDKQRQQQEIMKLYQEHGVNPFGSCLPLVAQIPVMISLYFMLRRDLRQNICPQVQPHHLVNGHSVINTAAHLKSCGPHGGAGFLFISDLTSSAKGASLIALAVLYVATQLAASLLMSVKSDDPQQERMRKMMMFMPVLFVFIFLSFPTGVLVYYITFNLFMIPQQLYIRRRLGPPTALVADSGGGGPAGGAGPPPSAGDGNGSGGLGGLLRGLAGGQPKAAEECEPVGAGARTRTRTAAPPPPPRKKKKRSGRRR